VTSSTSSSEPKARRRPGLALRAGLCALGWTLLYHALLPWLPHEHPHGRAQGVANGDRNRARAERYLARRDPPRVVVVGTSIAARLPDLPDDWHTLAFDGGSPLTGLAILLRRPAARRPEVVVVETNRILGDVDRDLVDELFAPRRRWLAERLPGLRADNRPSQVALATARAVRTALTGGVSEADRVRVPSARPDLREAMVARNLAALAESVPATWLEPRIDTLRRQVDELRRGGVRVVLAEMPEGRRSERSPLRRQLRARLARVFPPGESDWLPRPAPGDDSGPGWATTDGVHLAPESAERYARHVREWLQREPAPLARREAR